MLDTHFPYGGQIPSVGDPLDQNDSPGQRLGQFPGGSTPKTMSRRDEFTMTLMYNPTSIGSSSGTDAIRVPVGKLPWYWFGLASYDTTTGQWTETGADEDAGPYTSSSSDADFPTWRHNVKELRWVNIDE